MAYRLSGGTVTYFAGRKRHYSFYTVTAHLVEAFQDEVAAHESPVACATCGGFAARRTLSQLVD